MKYFKNLIGNVPYMPVKADIKFYLHIFTVDRVTALNVH